MVQTRTGKKHIQEENYLNVVFENIRSARSRHHAVNYQLAIGR